MPSTQINLDSDSDKSSGSDSSEAPFFDGTYLSQASTKRFADQNRSGAKLRIFDYAVPTWSILYNATLVALDILMSLWAAAFIFLIRPEAYTFLLRNEKFDHNVFVFLLLIAAAWIISLSATHIYARHSMGGGYDMYEKVLTALFYDFLILSTASYILKLDIPRSMTVFVPLCTTLLTLVERWLMRRSLHRHRRNDEYTYATIVAGSPEGIHTVLKQLRVNKSIGYAPIAVCPIVCADGDFAGKGEQRIESAVFVPQDEDEAKLQVLPFNSHLPETAKYLKAQTVLIADVISRDSETARTLSLAIEAMGIELALSVSVADLGGSSLRLRNDPTMPVLTARLSQYSLTTRVLKRLIDIVLSFCALVLSSPIMIWVAVRVKHEDGGPIFFVQKRIGLYGRPFNMYKFRSMRTDAEQIKEQLIAEYGVGDRLLFKLKVDPRVTTIGRLIRKFSLDEFPQFFNVLKGDMSLVGPRPALPEEVIKYGTLYSSRLLVKPGITGIWQISGRSDLSQQQSEFADVSYIQKWSLTGDIAILLKTVVAVLRGTGSY
ncbi:sugar transferase [Bifidobacterium aemilianum]|uniref:sugar transferase n=1 Tax=Bifidobacterium aemilianum TaxID=2493120 RepID=UPI001F1FA9CD|nr:sugar transferase [Bifidobacterium aemilianum]